MQLIRVAASTNNVGSLAAFTKVVGAFLVGGSADSSALVFDALTQTGTEKFGLKALLNTQSPYVNFAPQGVQFKTGVSVTLTGAAAVLYLVVE